MVLSALTGGKAGSTIPLFRYTLGRRTVLPRTPYIKELNERDISLLKDLYDYRMLTTSQIKKRYFADSKSYVDQKLHALRKSCLVSSFTLKGSRSREGKKGIVCHKITDRGISKLKELGMEADGPASRLKVSPASIPYVISANDMMIELTPAGWEFKDSRKTKKLFNLNFGDYIHGMLTDPGGKKYGMYILEEGTLPHNLGKIASEIRDAVHPGLANFLIFAKGPNSYLSFVERAINPKPGRSGMSTPPLTVAGCLKVMPLRLGLGLYRHFPTEGEWNKAVITEMGARIVAVNEPNQPFDVMIEHGGEEKYLVSLFDTDIMMIDRLRRYHARENGMRRVAVVTGNFMVHSAWVGPNPYIEYFEITPEAFGKMCERSYKAFSVQAKSEGRMANGIDRTIPDHH